MVLSINDFPKLLGILCQVYTLPTLQDDLTVIQHHAYQIQRLENDSSYLAKREGATATLYWDVNGAIKAIFNMDINNEVLQAFENSGVDLAQNVLAECERFMLNLQGQAFLYLNGAIWSAQLGSHWRNILRRPSGVATLSILIQLQPRWTGAGFVAMAVGLLHSWLTQGGNTVIEKFVTNARDAGNAPGDGRSIIEERTLRARPKSRFCSSPIQNSPFLFTVGTLDSLLTPLITC